MKQIIILLLALISVCGPASAQGRKYIKDAISRNGNCRNVAITRTGGDLMLYGTNGYASSGCPSSLLTALKELHDDEEYIDDVQLTEGGRWLILYGNNGFQWNDIPYSLERKIREYNNDGEVILSVTFNDAGDWVVITKNYYSASDYQIQEFLKEGNDRYGMLWSCCITDDALVAVYSNGYRSIGNVPSTLTQKLKNTDLDVYRLKIAGTAWFIADLKGHYSYYM